MCNIGYNYEKNPLKNQQFEQVSFLKRTVLSIPTGKGKLEVFSHFMESPSHFFSFEEINSSAQRKLDLAHMDLEGHATVSSEYSTILKYE